MGGLSYGPQNGCTDQWVSWVPEALDIYGISTNIYGRVTFWLMGAYPH